MNKKMFTLIVLLLLLLVFINALKPANAQNSNVIRIKADGTVTGTDKIKQDGTVYTVTADLYATVGQNEAFIFIEKNDITLNGAGYTVQGSGMGTAIYMLKNQNVVVENFVIRSFNIGIDFGIVNNLPPDSNYLSQPSAFNNKIFDNQIEVSLNSDSNQTSRSAGWCIYLNDAVQTLISGNNFTCHNPQGSIFFSNSTIDTNLIDNNFAGGGIYCLKSNQTTAQGNIIDGKPLIYLDSKSDQIIDGAGLVYLFNCNNIVVKNIKPTYEHAVTIQLVDTTKSEIVNSNGYINLINSSDNSIHNNLLKSITLDASSHNELYTNVVTSFSTCIKLCGASNFNKIYGNLLSDTIYSDDAERVRKAGFNTVAIQLGDIELGGVSNNDIQSNMIINHDCGFEFFLSSNNTLTTNTITNCNAGIQLGKSNYNILTENNITSCKYGISIYAESSNNAFHLNNFINNQIQCVESHHQTFLSDKETYATDNTFDKDQKGNYWDTYTGKDINGNGIGDTPYSIFENMTDNYPLMKPFKTSTTISTPAYNPTTTQPPSNNNTQTQFSKETKIFIIITIIIVAVISGLLVYFRRLIFR